MKRDWNEWINLSFINQDWVRTNYEKIRTIEISENNCSIYTKWTIRVTFSRIQDYTFTSTAHLTFYLFFFFLRRSFSSFSLLFPLMFTICCFIYYGSKEPNTSYTLHRSSYSIVDWLQHWKWSVIFKEIGSEKSVTNESGTKYTSDTFFFFFCIIWSF